MGVYGLFGLATELPTAKLPQPSTDPACLNWLRNIRNEANLQGQRSLLMSSLVNQQARRRRQRQATLIGETRNYRRFLKTGNQSASAAPRRLEKASNFLTATACSGSEVTGFFWIADVLVFIFYSLIQISSSDKGRHLLWIAAFFLFKSTTWDLFKPVPSGL